MSAISFLHLIIFSCIFIFIGNSLLILFGFLIELLIEQLEEVKIDKPLDMLASSIIGIAKGFIFVSLILFIFDTTPLPLKSKNSIYDRIGDSSVLFKPCIFLKDFLFNQ